MEFLNLPVRTEKDREYGITSIVDFGMPVGQLEHILVDYHSYIDIAKIGVGSAYVTPNIEEKLALYKKHNVKPYFGGTLFEKFYHQGKLDNYLTFLAKHNVEWIEVSTGVLDIDIDKRLDLVSTLKQNFNVIGEVGSKDAEIVMPLSQWTAELDALLEAGCKYVITEGRDSGTAGIYDKTGKVRDGLLKDILQNIDPQKVIFEAPHAKHQMFFINQIGPNVNLGNVKIQDVLLLEAQRCGLRNETFFMEVQNEISCDKTSSY
ncbi:phosphosulfolactate synthase [Pseudalkalibacillus caeni]|uniref:Phosphosulfolactate synthase n=1 Tax=Exobacillus caeni TaxID=2574798 RepID=A0A5R9F362_9BACL|nr:phosphosulfolactate synthase [Pseudalkalibacillus caeni]TLS38122.1 phosphosulfolactate synthase [Pseudalkalibacillus caeni]